MGTFDAILAETGTQFGIQRTSTTSLLSGLLSHINETPGGLDAFLEGLRKVGLGDFVLTWLGSGPPRPISSPTLEIAIGRDSLDKIAMNAGLPSSTASSVLAFMLPSIVQCLTPGGVIPRELSADVLAYSSSATSVVAAGTRQAAKATEHAARRAGLPAWIWPVLALLGICLLGYWLWSARPPARNSAFDVEGQMRSESEKANAALRALKRGFTAQELVWALNPNAINFAAGSAKIRRDSDRYLNRMALLIKAAPAGTVLEISGHTDDSGDATARMNLSLERAQAVRNYLIQQGVEPDALVATGYGDTRPVATNDTEEGRFRNCRIEFALRELP